MRSTIHVGDARAVLGALPAASVHCAVTSPPYWSLRDYGVDGQIGLEDTVDEWLRSLVAVFDQVHHVLRDDGTFWLNCGDAMRDYVFSRVAELRGNCRRCGYGKREHQAPDGGGCAGDFADQLPKGPAHGRFTDAERADLDTLKRKAFEDAKPQGGA